MLAMKQGSGLKPGVINTLHSLWKVERASVDHEDFETNACGCAGVGGCLVVYLVVEKDFAGFTRLCGVGLVFLVELYGC